MKEEGRGKVPDWVLQPFDDFIQYQKRVHNFYHIVVLGVQMLVHRSVRLDELYAQREELDQRSGAKPQNKRQADKVDLEIKREAELAKYEADRGFPILHEQQAIALWSSLECLVQDFLVLCLANEPSALKVEQVRRIRISLSDYDSLSGQERYRYIVSELERETKAGFRSGVDRFESLLDVLGLSGKVDDELKKNIFELGNVRNVTVHRRGIADRNLVEACPWLGLKVGDAVVVDRASFQRYFAAVFDYVGSLMDRFALAYSNKTNSDAKASATKSPGPK